MTAEEAYQLYRDRQDRKVHPDGSFDKQGRWYPSEEETQACCRGLSQPSKRWRYTLMMHCRTLTHVANLTGVPVSALRRLDSPPRREGGEDYYKAVALVDGRMYSIYDGKTEYVLGQEMRQQSQQQHGGGYYVYGSILDAIHARVPAASKLADTKRVIIQCRVGGSYCCYDNGKWAFSRLTPLRIVVGPFTDTTSVFVTHLSAAR